MNWELIVSIITALGIFEIIKRILSYILENNIIKRNIEIREIAERVLEWSSWLKLRNFEQPLPTEVTNKIYQDIFKIENFDKELSQDMMRLINYPQLNLSLYKNLDKQPENMRLITEHNNRLHDMTDKLNKKCNKLRYKPIFEIGELTRGIKKNFKK